MCVGAPGGRAIEAGVFGLDETAGHRDVGVAVPQPVVEFARRSDGHGQDAAQVFSDGLRGATGFAVSDADGPEAGVSFGDIEDVLAIGRPKGEEMTLGSV